MRRRCTIPVLMMFCSLCTLLTLVILPIIQSLLSAQPTRPQNRLMFLHVSVTDSIGSKELSARRFPTTECFAASPKQARCSIDSSLLVLHQCRASSPKEGICRIAGMLMFIFGKLPWCSSLLRPLMYRSSQLHLFLCVKGGARGVGVLFYLISESRGHQLAEESEYR